MVEVKLINKIPDKFSVDKGKETYTAFLYIKGVTPSFLNVIKRSIEEYVKTLAIEDVEIYENNSALWDEFIAHRLGLIPLKTPKGLDPNYKVEGYLEKSGQGYVLSKDIKFEDKNIKPVYENIPIIYLEQGQKIKMKVIATLGDGKTHAKWIPAHVYYYKVADIQINGELTKEEINSLKELGVGYKNKKLTIPEDKKYDRTFLDSLESVLGNKIKIVPRDDEFIFVIESFGNYDPKRILIEAIRELRSRLVKMMDVLMK